MHTLPPYGWSVDVSLVIHDVGTDHASVLRPYLRMLLLSD